MAHNAQAQLLREHVQQAMRFLEETMDGVTTELAHWRPPGVANPIGANYAHVVLGQDGAVNGILKGAAPLFAASWAGKTGVSELPPQADPRSPGFPDFSAWARRVQIDVPMMRRYAEAVYAATDEYLGALSDDELARPLDLSALGLRDSTVKRVLLGGVIGNALVHCGEIACLKGLQGGKGYPF